VSGGSWEEEELELPELAVCARAGAASITTAAMMGRAGKPISHSSGLAILAQRLLSPNRSRDLTAVNFVHGISI
jgi:hypothetical protein